MATPGQVLAQCHALKSTGPPIPAGQPSDPVAANLVLRLVLRLVMASWHSDRLTAPRRPCHSERREYRAPHELTQLKTLRSRLQHTSCTSKPNPPALQPPSGTSKANSLPPQLPSSTSKPDSALPEATAATASPGSDTSKPIPPASALLSHPAFLVSWCLGVLVVEATLCVFAPLR